MTVCLHIQGVRCPNCAIYYPEDKSVVTFTYTYAGTGGTQPQSKFKPESHTVGKVYDLTQENMQTMLIEIDRLNKLLEEK